jgi:hypothetical protein
MLHISSNPNAATLMKRPGDGLSTKVIAKASWPR